MKMYILSLSVGLLVGIIYYLLNIRSPAPPLIAIIGLLGMLSGEHIIPAGKFLISDSAFSSARTIRHILTRCTGIQATEHAHSSEEKRP